MRTGLMVGIAKKFGRSDDSGGGVPFGAEVEVEAGGNLGSALSSYDNVYVSGDITITSTITVADGKTIQWKDGITVTLGAALGSNAAMILQGELNLLISGEIEVVFEHTGDFIDGDNGTGTINSKGDIRFSSAASSSQEPFYRCNGSIETLIWECYNGSNELESYFTGGASIDRLEIIGAGTSTSMTIKNYRIGTLVVNGIWDLYASPATSNFSVWLNGSTCDKVAWEGSVSNNYTLYLSNGSLVSLFENTNASSNNVYISMAAGSAVLAFTDNSCRLSPSGTKNIVFGPGRIEQLPAESGAASATFYGIGFRNTISLSNMARFKFLGGYSAGAVTFTSSADNLAFVNHEFALANTFNSGSTGHRFTNCDFNGNETIPSGANLTFVNCRFSGTVAVDSGASSRFESCYFGSTFTNNDDPITVVSNCWDNEEIPWMNNVNANRVQPSLRSFRSTLVSVWRMQSSSTPEPDEVGSNDLTYNGTPTTGETGPDGGSILLDASGDFLQRTTTGWGHSTTESWTVMGWVKTPSDLPNATIVSWGSATSNAIAISFNTNNEIEVYERGGATARITYQTEPLPINKDEFRPFAVTYKPSSDAYVVYYGDRMVGSAFSNGQPRHDASASQFQIGCLNGSTQYFNGGIAEFRYYKGSGDTATLSERAFKEYARGQFYRT